MPFYCKLSTVSHSIPLGLYIHLPWCVRKCPYCDFNSHAAPQGFDEAAYVRALLDDLAVSARYCTQPALHSIFFGGGTPSLFSAASIEKILDACSRHFDIDNVEITLEANPGTFEQKKFSAFRRAGINRLSIGIQSFDSGLLQHIGRIHDGQQARRAVDMAHRAGFDNINIDLMYGLPSQTLQQAMDDVETACGCEVDHLSHYQLTIEPNTFFHKHPPPPASDELLWDMHRHGHDMLHHYGFGQYEVSAWAKANAVSRHNSNYWRFGDYLGIGAGAHGKLSRLDGNGKWTITRHWKVRQPQAYIEQARRGNACSGSRRLDENDILFEFLLNALRLKDGCSVHHFEAHTGLPYRKLVAFCQTVDRQWLHLDERKIVTTEQGYRFIDSILASLPV